MEKRWAKTGNKRKGKTVQKKGGRENVKEKKIWKMQGRKKRIRRDAQKNKTKKQMCKLELRIS